MRLTDGVYKRRVGEKENSAQEREGDKWISISRARTRNLITCRVCLFTRFRHAELQRQQRCSHRPRLKLQRGRARERNGTMAVSHSYSKFCRLLFDYRIRTRVDSIDRGMTDVIRWFIHDERLNVSFICSVVDEFALIVVIWLHRSWSFSNY